VFFTFPHLVHHNAGLTLQTHGSKGTAFHGEDFNGLRLTSLVIRATIRAIIPRKHAVVAVEAGGALHANKKNSIVCEGTHVAAVEAGGSCTPTEMNGFGFRV